MIRNLALALLFAAMLPASADRMPSVTFNVNHGKIGSTFSPENLSGDCKFESKVSEKFSLGTTLDIGAAADAPIRNIFTRVTERIAGRSVTADLTLGLGEGSGVSGDLDVAAEGDGPAYTATMNSNANGRVPYLEKFSIKSNRNKLTLHTDEDFAVELETEVALGGDTTCSVNIGHGVQGDARLKVTHSVDDDTRVTVKASSGMKDLEVALRRKMGGKDTFTPTYYAATKKVKLAWAHEIPAGRTLTTTVSQGSNVVDVELSGADDEDWTAKLSAPWDAPRDLDIALGRQFSVRSLADLSLSPLKALQGGSD